QAESFMKTLKYEEVYLYEYEDLSEARARIGHSLEEVYNQKRLPSALGYLPPAEFEQSLLQSTLASLLVSISGCTPLSLSCVGERDRGESHRQLSTRAPVRRE